MMDLGTYISERMVGRNGKIYIYISKENTNGSSSYRSIIIIETHTEV